jgi:hypothetical protein
MKITEIFIHMNIVIEVTILQTWRLSEKIVLFLHLYLNLQVQQPLDFFQ